MAKIDTAYLKANVTCAHCNGTNLVRRHKQSFKTVVDKAGDIVPEFKVNWCVFECTDCEGHTNVTDDGNELIPSGYGFEYGLHPFSCFDFCVNQYEGEICLEMYYLPTINDEYVLYDDLRDELILGFKEFFQKQGFHVDNLQENTWGLYFLEVPEVDSWEDAIALCIEAVKLSGARYDAEVFNDPDWGMEYKSEVPEFKAEDVCIKQKLRYLDDLMKPKVDFGNKQDPWS